VTTATGPTKKLAIPEPPVFTSVVEERRHRKQRLAAALRIFGRLGYDEGVAGHITVRDPEHPEQFWVNPFGVSFGRISVKDLILVDQTGEVIEGSRAVNRGAFVIHSAIHDLRPDVVAAAHAHSIHGRALAALGATLKPVVQEACAFFEDQAVYADYNGLALEEDEGRRMGEALGGNRAVVLQNHGVITVGASVEEAAYWFISFDRAAQVQLLAEAAGRPAYMDDAAARLAHRQFGYPQLARFSFEVLWDDILHTQPDLLDEQ
jgi:ribulose-5-phosphate 4-epimerase/fuculose-1-phosphate aldolase